MAIVFGVRGNSLTARYSNGGATGIIFGVVPGVTLAADAGAISGSSFQWTNNNSNKHISWPGRSNTPNGRAITVLLRWRAGYTGSPAANQALWSLITGSGKAPLMELSHTSTGTIIMSCKNELAAFVLTAASFGSFSPTSGTWYDIVFRWDGTTTANAMKVDIDASSIGTLTASAAFTASWTNQYFSEINLGVNNAGTSMNTSRVEEFVIWDTSLASLSTVTLDSGSGSLNGASRTSPVTVTAFDGSTYSDPGVANVLSTASYSYAGNSQTGTYVGPSTANVKTGVSFGVSSTGTYDGSDRWTDPGDTNVASGVAYKANSTSNNKTGSLAASGGSGNKRLGPNRIG